MNAVLKIIETGKIKEWVKRECNHKPMIIVKNDEQPNDTCKKGEQ